MSRMRIGLVGNPAAAKGRAREALAQVRTTLDIAGLDVVDVSGSSDVVAVRRARAVLPTLQALVAVGGDGTVALAAGVVAGTSVPLGIIPVGSGNDSARSVNIPLESIDAAVSVVVSALATGGRDIDIIEVSSEAAPTTPPVVVLGNISAGFDAVVNRRANSSRFGYTAAVLREVPRFHPRRYWIEVDGGERTTVDASILTICNSGIFGGGMAYSPTSRLDDGMMELVTVRPVSRLRLLSIFPRVFRGTHTSIPQFGVTQCREVRIGVDDTHMRYFTDGEERLHFPLRASIRPGGLRILAPSTANDT